MLVLTRKQDEGIVIGGNVVITVTQIAGGRVRLAIEAPREIRIDRAEVVERSACRRVVEGRAAPADSRDFVTTAG